MPNILHIDSSARSARLEGHSSISKTLAASFITVWQENRLEDEIEYRDLSINPPAFVSEDWIAAVFKETSQLTAADKALIAPSDTLIGEIERADIILMSAPMYNYGMPGVLKAWFDQIIRINKTFSFDLARGDQPLEPILSGKVMVLVTSSGEANFQAGEIRAHEDHLTSHIKLLSPYLGVDEFISIYSEFQEFSDQRHRDSLDKAEQKIRATALQLIERYKK
ncbi:MAG: NAD(P)H-dependent oxidoreductase [Oceanospirillaceae bacterium]